MLPVPAPNKVQPILAHEHMQALQHVTPSHNGLCSMEEANSNTIITRLDRAGLTVSSLCLLHCIASIVLVSGLGLSSQFLLAEEIHEYGLMLAFIIAVIAIGWGAITHRQQAPFLVAITGLAFMAGALAMPHDYRELVLTIIGVSLVALAHLLNMQGRLHRAR